MPIKARLGAAVAADLPDMTEARRSPRPPAIDPYLELELYLEKVNEEIGKVLNQYLEKDGEKDRSIVPDLRGSPDSVDGCVSTVNIGTQTSPTRSQNSSPGLLSDCDRVSNCSSSFTFQTSCSSSCSYRADDPKSASSSSLDNLARLETTPTISSDSELLSPHGTSSCKQAYEEISQFRALNNPEDNDRHYRSSSSTSRLNAPVWVLRQDVKRHRSAEDRRGVYFDSLNGFEYLGDQLDEPLNSTSAHSLPIPHANNVNSNNNNIHQSHMNVNHHNTSNMLIAELGNKSSSAPVLKKVDESSEQLSSHILKVTKQSRSQSDRHLAEIQAAEACKWLRAAGFPQYAQMYEEHQFPIDLSSVQKDHPFLEPDSCRSLFRRLDTLNRCANIKVDSWRSTQDDSEDENQCALSGNWTFQHDQKRWSRTRGNEPLQPLQTITSDNSDNMRFEQEKKTNSRNDLNLLLDSVGSDDITLNRSGSERLKDGAKAFLRRVESLKSRRRKRQNREGVVINKTDDVLSVQQKMNSLEIPTLVLPKNVDGDNYSSDNSKAQNSPQLSPSVTSPLPSPRRLFVHSPLFQCRDITSRRAFVNRRGSVSLDRRDTVEVLSDSELQRSTKKVRNIDKIKQEAQQPASDYDSDLEEGDISEQFRTSWHSIQRGVSRSAYSNFEGCPICCLTCGQLQVLRKLALLKLTALIEKHCPTHKTGWNWELPKFIRKIKTPDYKYKLVFGVPLTVILQRSGHPLPSGIRKALKWLRSNALDQVGLFRKSGVRSRIHALKTSVEATNEFAVYDVQQSYDVADMVKQYFRELPEALLTTKLSETLILIFQYLPSALRREAVSCVLLLMPNENCEVLQNVLDFLQAVSEFSVVNQMTASNLALCFAPSLFYYNQSATLSPVGRANSVSPRRRKGTGVPDLKELSENKAAHECLLYLITNQRTLFTVPKDMLVQCKFSDLDESKPLPLSELGEPAGWKSYLEACIHALQKEAKDRTRGWIYPSGNHNTEVELAYKKVGDGHPLRLWRVATEVEAPPQEVLHRVLRERHIWDQNLMRLQIVQQLDSNSEVYQYMCSSMEPLAARNYCVLRTWKTDLPRGACVIVETSVEHKDAEPMSNSVRAVVLASRYLIEPCGSGKSRLMHLSRVDLMGRTPEWYNKSYGHVCKLHLCEIRNSFKHSCPIGPESKV